MSTRKCVGRLVFGLTLVMTEVAGPPGPAERFSSLPIREADTAMEAGADGSELIIRCDMTQKFGTGVQHRRSTSHGKPDSGQWMPSRRSRHGFQTSFPNRFPAGPMPSGS